MEENADNIGDELDSPKKCLYCSNVISEKARVCHHCGRDQRRLINIVKDVASIATLAMIGIAIVQVIVNYGQFKELKSKRIEAAQVLEKANQIYNNASTISTKAVEKANHVFSNASGTSNEAIKKARAVLVKAEKGAKSATIITEKAEKEMKNTISVVNKQLSASNEHISKTEKELIEKIDTLDPFKQPIYAVSATVEAMISSPDCRHIYLNTGEEGAHLVFIDAKGVLFSMFSTDSYLNQDGNNHLVYSSTLRLPETSTIIGKPVSFFKQIQSFGIKFDYMKDKERVVGGRVVVIINNAIQLNFKVSEQQITDKIIVVQDLASSLSVLK